MHPVEDIGISPWPVDMVEFGADAYAHRKEVDVKQLYNQVPQTAWVSQFEEVSSRRSWRLDAREVRTSSRQRAWVPCDPRLSSPARMLKKCCYGQRTLGSICGSLSPSPTHLSHIININPFATLSRIKCESYIFLKKCFRSFIGVVIMLTMFPHVLWLWLWVYNRGTRLWNIPTLSLDMGKPPPTFSYRIKQSDGEAPVML